MLENTDANSGNVPIMVWCVSSLDIQRGNWKCIGETKIKSEKNENSTSELNDHSLLNNICGAEK